MKKEEKLKLLNQMKEEYERALFLLQVEERVLQRILVSGKNPPELGEVQNKIGELKVRLETIEDIEKDLEEKGDWPEKEKK